MTRWLLVAVAVGLLIWVGLRAWRWWQARQLADFERTRGRPMPPTVGGEKLAPMGTGRGARAARARGNPSFQG